LETTTEQDAMNPHNLVRDELINAMNTSVPFSWIAGKSVQHGNWICCAQRHYEKELELARSR
jgi:hypothetical protein